MPAENEPAEPNALMQSLQLTCSLIPSSTLPSTRLVIIWLIVSLSETYLPGEPVNKVTAGLRADFAELAGADLGEEETDGRSLLPLLRGEESRWWPRRGRSTILLEGFVGKGARLYGGVRTNTHKYVEYGNGETELYDLEADPYELDNVYETADPSLIEDLKARLEALRDCQGEGCREAEDAS